MALKARKIKRKVEKLFKRADGEWLQTTTAALGNGDGIVQSDTDGLVYARLRNGETIKVFNDVAPADFDVRVLIGKKKEQPNLWRVIAVRDAYSTPQAPRVQYHHEQHEFGGPDMLPVNRKQIMALTAIVDTDEPFTVMVYGGVIRTATGKARVDSQLVDLSSYIPTSGAVYVDIEADADGVLSVNEGAGFASPLVASVSYMPATTAGKYWICTVLLFEGMEELLNEHILVPFPVSTDYSLFGNINLDDLLDVNAPTPADTQVLTWDDGGGEWVAADAAGGSGHSIEEEGTPLTARSKLNFVGGGVTVTDDSGDDASVVTVPDMGAQILAGTAEDDEFELNDAIGFYRSGTGLMKILWSTVKLQIIALFESLFASLSHNHDGSDTIKLAQANTHESPDTDSGPTSLHHTIGTGANQAAAGTKGVTNGDTHNHVGGDGAALSYTVMLPAHGLNGTIAAPAGTAMFTPLYHYGLNATGVVFTVDRAGTLELLSMWNNSAQPATGSLVVTVRKNNVDTALTVTYVNADGVAYKQDTTHTVSVVAGDTITIRLVNNASTASAQINGLTLGFRVATT